MADRSFEGILTNMVHDWIEAEPEHETDEEQATALLQFVLEIERRRHHADFPGPQRDRIDRATMQRLKHPDTLGPEFSRAEGAFRRLTKSPLEAVQYLGAAVRNDRGRQAEIARKPRPGRQDSITAFINDLVAKNPNISVEAVRSALKRSREFTVHGGEVRSHDEDAASMQLKNLSSRLTNAKKRLSR